MATQASLTFLRDLFFTYCYQELMRSFLWRQPIRRAVCTMALLP